MADWMKSTVSELISAYRTEENLYNQKHKLYYNKKARILSMKRILDAMQVKNNLFCSKMKHLITSILEIPTGDNSR